MGDNDLITINFNGHQLETFQQGGEEWVTVRSIAGGIGLHVEAQRKKLLKSEKKFSCSLKRATAKDGKEYETHCIPVKKVPGWLFTIDPERVKPEVKPAVELYQEQCFDVLYDYWHNKTSEPPAPPQPTPAIGHRRIVSADLVIVWSNGDIEKKEASPANVDTVFKHLAPKWLLMDKQQVQEMVRPLRDAADLGIQLWSRMCVELDKRQGVV